MKNHPIPPTENHWNQFDILDKKLDIQVHEMLAEDIREEDIDVVKAAKLTYQSCMDVGESTPSSKHWRNTIYIICPSIYVIILYELYSIQ